MTLELVCDFGPYTASEGLNSSLQMSKLFSCCIGSFIYAAGNERLCSFKSHVKFIVYSAHLNLISNLPPFESPRKQCVYIFISVQSIQGSLFTHTKINVSSNLPPYKPKDLSVL